MRDDGNKMRKRNQGSLAKNGAPGIMGIKEIKVMKGHVAAVDRQQSRV